MGIYSPFLTISIHVPRVEDDVTAIDCQLKTSRFQSTSPGWRTTYGQNTPKSKAKNFNPRPPGGGRPPTSADFRRRDADFNPRPPGGGRHKQGLSSVRSAGFQSTSPVWRTTKLIYQLIKYPLSISIHVPRVEDDRAAKGGR